MKIRPFKGIRPPQNLVESVQSRPYDVLNSAEARAEAEGNEKSLYRIIKPEIDFPVGTDEHEPAVYEKAAENFRNFQSKGWLVQDSKERRKTSETFKAKGGLCRTARSSIMCMPRL